MKKKLLFFVLFIIGIAVNGQPAIKVFAFEQENLPGMKPAGVKDENGNPIKKAAARKNYFIFLSYKKIYTVTPVYIFIKDSSFGVQIADVKKTPVEYTNNTIPNKPEKKILVPKTGNKVIQVKLTETPELKNKDIHIQKLTKANDVVIAYVWNKRKYFITLKKIKELEPVANE
jgi:hypothetical protein